MNYLIQAYKVSQRRACCVLAFHRSVIRYRSVAKDWAYLVKRIRELATIRVHYGYRRIHTLLQREGLRINHKRVYRLYCLAGLQMRLKSPKRRVSAKLRCEPKRAER